ncbi:MAG: ArnT family glycosyltransferase [Puniceicoccales bacterium]
MQSSALHPERSRWPIWVLCLSALYTVGFLVWYSSTALGMSPVLDGRENLQLAAQMASGSLASEPFYRAPLYPFLLSLPLRLGFPAEWMPALARLLNGLFHLINVVLVLRMSQRLWGSTRAAVLSGLLVGFNPVLLHFAADPLDITLGITWLLLGCEQALKAHESGRLCPAVLAGVFLILGVYTRPHLLPVAVVTPFVLWPRSWRLALAACVPLVAGAMSYGGINLARSGSFTPLPTQGGYNLWAANKPGANGAYYTQSINVSSLNSGYLNPARQESAILYTQATSQPAGENPAAESAYWRDRALKTIIDQPMDGLGLMARKTGLLLDDYEPYNNQTYAFHKELSPWLRWNPLGWALLLGLGLAGAFIFWRKSGVRIVLLWGLAYSAGVLLYYVSARFRLPLVPLLAVLAGGCVPACALLRTRSKRAIAGVVLGVIIFGLSALNAFVKPDTDTTSEDYLLLAQASNELAWDADTLHWANESQALRPSPEAAELIVLAQFNLWLSGEMPPPAAATAESFLSIAQAAAQNSRQARWVLGVIQYKLGQQEAARRTWQSLLPPEGQPLANTAGGDAAAMLQITNLGDARQTRPQISPSPLLDLISRAQADPTSLSKQEQQYLQFLTTPITDVNKP